MDRSRVKWRKASHSSSNGGACVEVAGIPAAVAVRDSKDPDGPQLAFTASEWKTFVRRAKSGRYDVS